ncbi:hypothetical protein DDE74_30195 [Streptomyces lydicus]|uniref:Uncharacterized protein n=1 Tax=Streptomyces lydicus TaxID=47763 RepID=A0A3Q9K956_9ACTN|nr:hypothetical protein DDE74_30195 [Streptomyces lydicus]
MSARARGLRPPEEYRTPTNAEWEDFLGHFERRKHHLELAGRRCPVKLRPLLGADCCGLKVRFSLTAVARRRRAPWSPAC